MQYIANSYSDTLPNASVTFWDCNVPVACAVGDIIVALVYHDTGGTGGNGDIQGVTDTQGKVSWSFVRRQSHANNNQCYEHWVGKVTTAFSANGSTTRVTLTLSRGSPGTHQIALTPSAGYAFASTPVQQHNGTTWLSTAYPTGTDALTSGNVTTTGGNKFTRLGVAYLEDGDANALTNLAASSGYTSIGSKSMFDVGVPHPMHFAFKTAQDSAGTYQATFTNNGDANGAGQGSVVVLAIEEVSLSGPPFTRPFSPDAAGMRTVLRM